MFQDKFQNTIKTVLQFEQQEKLVEALTKLKD